MGQINDTTGIPKTESVLRIQAPAEGLVFPTLKRGSDTILEAALVVRGHDNVARKPGFIADSNSAGIVETHVLISWIHPNHTSGIRQVEVPAVGGPDFTVALGDGLMATVYGTGFVVGLPLTARYFKEDEIAAITAGSATQNLRLVLKGQNAGASERVGDVVIGLSGNSGGVGDGVATDAGEKQIGVTQYVDGSILFFTYNSNLTTLA